MNKNKENAQADWTDMIVKSWTWAKLTNDELIDNVVKS